MHHIECIQHHPTSHLTKPLHSANIHHPPTTNSLTSPATANADVALLLPLALVGGPPPPPTLPLVLCLNLEDDEAAIGEFSWLSQGRRGRGEGRERMKSQVEVTGGCSRAVEVAVAAVPV